MFNTNNYNIYDLLWSKVNADSVEWPSCNIITDWNLSFLQNQHSFFTLLSIFDKWWNYDWNYVYAHRWQILKMNVKFEQYFG